MPTLRHAERFHVKKKILLVMARHPTPGHCKTRLSPPLTPEEGAAVQDAMIRDLARMTKELTDTMIHVRHTPPDSSAYFTLHFPHARLFSQEGSDLGERLSHAFREAFRNEGALVCAVGTDSPQITPDQIREAFDRIDVPPPSVVIGPARDGGYWLIGMNRFTPELFREIPWGEGTVLSTTLRRAEEMDLPVFLLAQMGDMDTAADLFRYEPAGAYGVETAAVVTRLAEKRA